MTEPGAPSRRGALYGLAGAAALVTGCRENTSFVDMEPPDVRKPTQAEIDAVPIGPRATNEMSIALSGDGRLLAVPIPEGPVNEILVINIETLETISVRHPSDRVQLDSVRFGGDGNTLLFNASPYSFRGISDLVMLDLTTRESTIVRGTPPKFFYSASLSADRKQLVYFRSFEPHLNPRVTPETAIAGFFSLFAFRFGDQTDRRLTPFRWRRGLVCMQQDGESCIVSTRWPLTVRPGTNSDWWVDRAEWEYSGRLNSVGWEEPELSAFAAFRLSLDATLERTPETLLPIVDLTDATGKVRTGNVVDANSSGSILFTLTEYDPTLPGNQTRVMWQSRNRRVARQYIGKSARYMGGAISGDGRTVVGAISGYLGDVPGNIGFGNFADATVNGRYMFDLYVDGRFIRQFEKSQFLMTGAVTIKPTTVVEIAT